MNPTRFSRRRRAALGSVALALAAAAPARAGQVVLDGTVGPAGSRLGPNYLIPQSVGRLQGTNLFHSFSQFSLDAGESATFTASAGTPVGNVIARVTGGSASTINGTLRCDVAGANFFLINPSGVVFGPSSRLDVQGSFAVATAAYLKLSDGTRFSAVAPQGAVLTSAPPAAFGFLAARPGAVTFSSAGAPAGQPPTLSVPQGQTISLVGGPVRIDGGQVQAVGGRVNVVSVAGPGEFPVDYAPTTAAPAGLALGTVSLTGGALLSAPVGGRVSVRSGSLTIDASSINADTDVVPGGGVDLLVTGAAAILDGGVSSQTTGSADAGPVRVSAASLALTGPPGNGTGSLDVSTAAAGRGGDVTLSVGSLAVGSNASVRAFTTASGAGGDIAVTAARDVRIDGGGASSQTGLACETRASVGGPAGSVSVTSPRVELLDEGEITSLTKGTGAAGDIDVRARSLLIDGGNAPLLTGLQGRVGEGVGDTGAAGPGGAIRVAADSVTLRDGGVITSSTFGSGAGGSVRLTANGRLRVAGAAASEFTGVFSQSLPVAGLADPGAGGDVSVRAGALNITGPASMLAGISARSTGAGAAGRTDVRAGAVRVSRGGAISVEADAAAAGTLSVAADRTLLLNDGTVSAAGQTGGNVSLQTGGLLLLSRSSVTARAGSAGGRITLGLPSSAVFLDGGTIDGRSGGTPVRVRIQGPFLRRGGQILTDSPQSFPTVDLTGSLVALPSAAPSSLRPLPDVCGTRLGADLSSFVVTGLGGIPPAPAGWSPDEAGPAGAPHGAGRR